MTEVEQLLRALPEPFTVVIQPQSVMANTWGATFAWPRREIWIAARDAHEMVRTLCHEVAHARTRLSDSTGEILYARRFSLC